MISSRTIPGVVLTIAMAFSMAFSLAFAAARPAVAQEPLEVLASAAERYRDLTGFCADFRQVVSNEILGETTRSRGELCQARPDRFEMRFSQPDGDRVVADGEHLWVYLPSSDPTQVYQTTLAESGGRFDLHEEFLTEPGERYAPRSEGLDELDGRRVHVLALEPLRPSPYARARIWVDAEDHLIRRIEIVEEEGFTRTLHLSAIRLEPAIPPERFAFEPPGGVRVVRP